MITQSINLNLIPGQVLPRVNASQYDDNSRTLNMYLYNGEQAFLMASGYSAFVQGTKPDRTGFQYSATPSTGTNLVSLDITEQMCAVSGEVTCELVITDSDERIATVNFILYVEPAALADDTIISETEIPLIEEAAELAEHIQGYIDEINADADRAEGYAVGTHDGTPVPSTDPAYENNAKYYAEQAATSAQGVEQYVEDAEAYALGTRAGVPVTSGDVTYENNSKYYAGQASGSASSASSSASDASSSALDAEAYAVGTRNGTAVTSGDVAYENNAKYYAGEASTSAGNASTSETNAGLSESAAAQSEEDAEAWAVGERGGVPVTSGDPTYENNAKYWAGEASAVAVDMVGATASTNGVHGLVPQPLLGEEDKVLKGSGVWDYDTLAKLADVNLSNPAEGDLLRYNSTSQKWENVIHKTLTQTLAAGSTTVTFTDAAITANANCALLTNPVLNFTSIDDSITNTIVVTFPAQSSPVSVKLVIGG